MTNQPTAAAAAANPSPAPKPLPSPNGDSPNGSPHPSPAKRPAKPARASRLRAVLIVGLVVAVAAGGVTAFVVSSAPKGPRPDLILHRVRPELVNLTVVERGALESADNREVVCRVKAGTKTSSLSIKWVIDDG